MNPILSYLNAETAMLSTMNTRQQFHGYASCGDFILRNGRAWNWQPYPKDMRALKMGACFRNAQILAMNHNSELIYCEGYADGGIPMLHAWTVNLKGDIIDPTWTGRGKNTYTTESYFGVAILTRYMADTCIRTRWHRSLIENHHERWPMLKDDKKLWRHPINDL